MSWDMPGPSQNLKCKMALSSDRPNNPDLPRAASVPGGVGGGITQNKAVVRVAVSTGGQGGPVDRNSATETQTLK